MVWIGMKHFTVKKVPESITYLYRMMNGGLSLFFNHSNLLGKFLDLLMNIDK